VRLSDTLSLALRNLRESKLRTVLTSLGVSIGIASLVGMVSFGVALQDQVLGNLLRSGVFDSITVTAAPRLGGRGRRGGDTMARAREAAETARQSLARLDDEAVRKLAAIPGVKEAFPDVRVAVELTYGDFSEFTGATGVSMSSRGQGVFQKFSFGGFFQNDTDDTCLLSLEFAKRLDERAPGSLVGKEVTLAWAAAANPAASLMSGMPPGMSVQRSERKFRVAGIVERQAGPSPGGALFAAVMIPLARAKEMGAADLTGPQALLRQLSDKRVYSMITVKVNRAQDTEAVEKKIKEMGFGAFSIADLLESQKKAFILLDLLLGLVGSIALTVASLGIVNTMVMSILERTREIGVMKAIGGGDDDVRRIFLIEASLIGLMGGVFGIVLGWAVGRVINAGANYYLSTQGVPAANLFLIPWWLTAGAIAFALVVSLLAGSFPAMRAARLDPIQALRHD
jgi:ABC-type antimicrobial peptide transport system permease subunit